MRYALAFAGLTASVYAQAVTEPIEPEGSAPEGCQPSYDGEFFIGVQNQTDSKRSLTERQERCSGDTLVLTLKDGILTDASDRTGYVASNYQFQFDGPPQAGAIYTAGFAACSDGRLALGSSKTFYQCLSGDFYNLYDRDWAPQCVPIDIFVNSCGGSGSGGGVGQQPDGQPTGGQQVSQIGDGQIQAPTGAPVTQLPDGQPQAPGGGAPVSQIPDGQPQAPTGGAPVSQIPDGQPQAPTGGAPVSQIPDGQPQAPTGAPVSQIPDGQPQAPTGAPVSQIPDGQPQAPTGGAPVSQIPDGQPQAPTGAPVTQIPDGQPQAPTGIPVSQIPDGQPQVPPVSLPTPVVPSGGEAGVTPAPTAAGFKVAPGHSVALVVAAVGAYFYL